MHIASRLFAWLTTTHERYSRRAYSHPTVLIIVFIVYAILTALIFFISGIAGIFITDACEFNSSKPSCSTFLLIFLFIPVLLLPFGVLALLIINFFTLVLRSYVANVSAGGYGYSVTSVVQLIGMTMFLFAAMHYYVALFSDTPAYDGLNIIIYDEFLNTERVDPFWRKLASVPHINTVIDCVYFSAATMATVGYGDIHPVSPIAKIATTIQIFFSFALIVVVLAATVGRSGKN